MKTSILSLWRNVSIAKKLYSLVGVMTILVAGELLTLRFAMHTLSAVRAFVGGEAMWSKAQKNSLLSLYRYSRTKKEADYQIFRDHLSVPAGDHRARLELLKPGPDLAAVRAGFLQGRIDAADIDSMVELLRRFHSVSYLSRAIYFWGRGDELLSRLHEIGDHYHALVLAGSSVPELRLERVLAQATPLNRELTQIEESFSEALSEGSRWLERVVISLLFLAVLTVESIGLTLTFLTSRGISRDLAQLNRAAKAMGAGDFGQNLKVRSRDEIGELTASIKIMGEMLQRSYRDLESRVEKRTKELALSLAENAKLYQEARAAVETRDDFISIASHELKTPLTALILQLGYLERCLLEGNDSDRAKAQGLSAKSLRQAHTLGDLLNRLMDLTQIRSGKIEFSFAPCDLVVLVKEVAAPFVDEAARHGSLLSLHLPASAPLQADPMRIGQVLRNLLSNAIKYGNGQAIDLKLELTAQVARIIVSDRGFGIPSAQQNSIFERFERATTAKGIAGMGLGLFISRQIVDAHRGSLRVQSQLGQGSTFTVELPRQGPAALPVIAIN